MSALCLVGCTLPPTITNIAPSAQVAGGDIEIFGRHMERDKVQKARVNGANAPIRRPPASSAWLARVPAGTMPGVALVEVDTEVDTAGTVMTATSNLLRVLGETWDEADHEPNGTRAEARGSNDDKVIPQSAHIVGSVDNFDTDIYYLRSDTGGAWAQTIQVSVKATSESASAGIKVQLAVAAQEIAQHDVPTDNRYHHAWMTAVQGRRLYLIVEKSATSLSDVQYEILVGRVDVDDEWENNQPDGKNEDLDAATSMTFAFMEQPDASGVRSQESFEYSSYLTPAYSPAVSVSNPAEASDPLGPRCIGLEDVYALTGVVEGDTLWIGLDYDGLAVSGFGPHVLRARFLEAGSPPRQFGEDLIGSDNLVIGHVNLDVGVDPLFLVVDVLQVDVERDEDDRILKVTYQPVKVPCAASGEPAPLRARVPYELQVTRPGLDPLDPDQQKRLEEYLEKERKKREGDGG